MVRATGIFLGWTGFFRRKKSGEFDGKIRLAHGDCRRRVQRGIDAKNRFDVKHCFAPKADVDIKLRLVHKRVHALVFIVWTCRVMIAGAAYIRPLLLEPARVIKARSARAVTIMPKFVHFYPKSFSFLCSKSSRWNERFLNLSEIMMRVIN